MDACWTPQRMSPPLKMARDQAPKPHDWLARTSSEQDQYFLYESGLLKYYSMLLQRSQTRTFGLTGTFGVDIFERTA